jgi:hypothetical protein
MLDKAAITQKVNQLLAKLRANTEEVIEEGDFKKVILKI